MADQPLPSVMILGCGRSGTSIFGELFEHIGDYTYKSEPPFEEVMQSDYSTPRAFKVPRESESHPPDPGLSFPLSAIRARIPTMKFFWIVRHPLDAISSLRVGISQNWGHHPRPPDWQHWLSRPLIERCAHHWSFLNSVGFEQISEIATLVQFEAMISNPAEFARSVCETVGAENSTQTARVGDWVKRVQNENNADFVEACTSRTYSRPDHSVRVGRWRENLSDTDISRVLPIVAKTGKSFGYDLPIA